jgi:hypothetical protein
MGAHLVEALTSFLSWCVTSVQTVVPIFYTAEEGLTIFGWLGMGGLSVGLFTLFVAIFRDFLHFGR